MVFKGQHSRTLIVKHHAMAESSVQLAGPEQLLRQWRALLAAAAAGAKLLQLCPTICYPVDCSLPGSSVHGILQARILEWVAMSCSRRFSQASDRTCISFVSNISRQILYH